jgi:hypothetical protein
MSSKWIAIVAAPFVLVGAYSFLGGLVDRDAALLEP